MSQHHPATTALEQQIRSQPSELERMVRASEQQIRDAVEGLKRSRRIWLVGTGTSQHAAELGVAMFHEAGRAAQAIPSMHFVEWAPVVGPQDGVIIISHTGETAYALSGRAQAVLAGLSVFSITRRGLGLPHTVETTEKETAETYTVSYTTALMVLARIAHGLGAESFAPETLARVPSAVQWATDAHGTDAIPIPPRLLVIFGAGPASVTAREGALKVREASRFPAEGYDSEYLLHGSAVPLTAQDHLVALTTPDPSGFTEAVAHAAQVEGIGVTRVAETADLPPVLAQIPLTVRLQQLALRFALARAQNPDVVITGAWADPNLWTIGSPGQNQY